MSSDTTSNILSCHKSPVLLHHHPLHPWQVFSSSVSCCSTLSFLAFAPSLGCLLLLLSSCSHIHSNTSLVLTVDSKAGRRSWHLFRKCFSIVCCPPSSHFHNCFLDEQVAKELCDLGHHWSWTDVSWYCIGTSAAVVALAQTTLTSDVQVRATS